MELLDRIRGCLLGGAVGDALGYAVEFTSAEEIRCRYGEQGIAAPVLTDGVARISDDTQMTLFTCEGLIFGYDRGAAGGMAAAAEVYVHDAYLNWLATQGCAVEGAWRGFSYLMQQKELYARRAPGNTCMSALLSGRMGTLDEPINDSCGCGGVMRAAPAGFVAAFGRRYDDAPEDAHAWQGAKIAAITHGHPLGWMPAAMLADLIHRIVRTGGSTLRENARAALERTLTIMGKGEDAAVQTFRNVVERAMTLSAAPGHAETHIHSLGGGWTGHEALAIALYCALRYENDFVSCLRAAVNHDGDSDSTGAIAGQLLGTLHGAACVPAAWLEHLELRETVETMARGLCRVAGEQRIG